MLSYLIIGIAVLALIFFIIKRRRSKKEIDKEFIEFNNTWGKDFDIGYAPEDIGELPKDDEKVFIEADVSGYKVSSVKSPNEETKTISEIRDGTMPIDKLPDVGEVKQHEDGHYEWKAEHEGVHIFTPPGKSGEYVTGIDPYRTEKDPDELTEEEKEFIKKYKDEMGEG